MLENTTRSATVVFRFCNITLAKFLLKRHTRFAYVVRIGPCGLHRTLAGSFGDFQPPCRARRARDCAPYLARFLASSNVNLGQTKIVIRFSPVTDAIGLIRRCQRSTCVAAALPAPKWRKEKSIYEGITPRTVEMIPHPPPPRQWPRPPKLARAPCGQNHEFAANASIKCNGPLPSLFQSTLRLG